MCCSLQLIWPIYIYNITTFFHHIPSLLCVVRERERERRRRRRRRNKAMVSLQPTLSPSRRKAISSDQYDQNLSKKRKLQEGLAAQTQQIFEKRSKGGETTKFSTLVDIELHLETPLPLEWQRCLDIQVYL
jgi:hypothetical protein